MIHLIYILIKMSRKNDKMIAVRFEMVALRQWAKISVQRCLPLSSIKPLLAAKFDCELEHLPMRASAVAIRQGKNVKIPLSILQPIQEIDYFREPLQEHRVVIEWDYWGG